LGQRSVERNIGRLKCAVMNFSESICLLLWCLASDSLYIVWNLEFIDNLFNSEERLYTGYAHQRLSCEHRRRLWRGSRNVHAFITFYHLLPPQYFGFPTQYFWQVYASGFEHFISIELDRSYACQKLIRSVISFCVNNLSFHILYISLRVTHYEIFCKSLIFLLSLSVKVIYCVFMFKILLILDFMYNVFRSCWSGAETDNQSACHHSNSRAASWSHSIGNRVEPSLASVHCM